MISLLAIGFVGAGHPFDRFGPANQITAARATIVALVAGLVGEVPSAMVGTCAAFAALVVTMLDGADGWTARRSRLASVFGARFDMEVDALLILTLSILVWQHAKAGPWIVMAGLLRYAFVLAGWIAPWLERPLPLSRRRQAVCVVQIVGLSAVLLPVMAPRASAWVAAGVLAALVYSFAADVAWLWRDID